MRRKADELLREWRDRADRKPLLVKGVRQCGKTYLLRTYAQDLFESVVYVNLENDRSARADFSGGLDPHSIVRAIEARTGQRIVPGKTLLFIDEIQACEEALTSLKYFCEDAPEYYVAAAGSLLGVAINQNLRSEDDSTRFRGVSLGDGARSAGRRDTLIIRVNGTSCAKPS